MSAKRIAITTALIATIGVGAPTAAMARHGADDAAGHVRHSGHVADSTHHSSGSDDDRRHARTSSRRHRGADDAARGTTDDHGRRHGGHGADD